MLKRISKEQSVCKNCEDLFMDDMEKCRSAPSEDDSIYYKVVKNLVLCNYIASSYFHKRISNNDMYMIFPYYYLNVYSDSEIMAIFKKCIKPCGKINKHSGFSATGLTDKFTEWIKNNGQKFLPEIFLPLINNSIKDDEKDTVIYTYYDDNIINTYEKIYQQVSELFNDSWFANHGNLNLSYMTLDEINSSPLVKSVMDLSYSVELYCYPIKSDNNIIYVKYLHWLPKIL